MIERGLDLKMCFPNGVRGDLFDDELLDKLARAGAYMITFAPESGSPRVQKYIEKYAKLDKIQEMITKASARGLWCHGFFMVGFPTETAEEMRMTFDFALRNRSSAAPRSSWSTRTRGPSCSRWRASSARTSTSSRSWATTSTPASSCPRCRPTRSNAGSAGRCYGSTSDRVACSASCAACRASDSCCTSSGTSATRSSITTVGAVATSTTRRAFLPRQNDATGTQTGHALQQDVKLVFCKFEFFWCASSNRTRRYVRVCGFHSDAVARV